MGIDTFAIEKQDSFMSSTHRASYRTRFREDLAAGVVNMKLNVYCKSGGGARQACVFVWKVPIVFSPCHTGRSAAVMDKCQEIAPNEISRELVTHFNLMMDQISDISSSVRDAMRNYLFLGKVNPDGKANDTYCQLILDLAAGLPAWKKVPHRWHLLSLW